jgi:GNAT superfamily N-acetyltransferase
MEFRRAFEEDINSIMNIIRQAQEYFREQGINQWQNNYPNFETIRNDINNNNSYVLLQDNIIVGTAAIIFDGDKNYDVIYHGTWISDNKYAAIHRIAVDSVNKGLGLASLILKHVEEMCLDMGIHSIRVDTHEENMSMQKFLNKNGFQYCGIIYLADKSKRIAFEKIL